MSTPTVKNVCKAAREQEGYKSFCGWYDGEENLYIGRNAGKYTQRGVPDSKWSNPFICCDWDAAKSDWVVEEMVNIYEKYVRRNVLLMNSLHELEGKQLGCWCKPGVCHGDILVKLYQEKYGEQASEKNEEQAPENSGVQPVEKRRKTQKN